VKGACTQCARLRVNNLAFYFRATVRYTLKNNSGAAGAPAKARERSSIVRPARPLLLPLTELYRTAVIHVYFKRKVCTGSPRAELNFTHWTILTHEFEWQCLQRTNY